MAEGGAAAWPKNEGARAGARARSLGRRVALTAMLARRIPFEGRVPFASPGRLRELQERRIAEIVDLAATTVPHYRETLGAGRLGALRSAGDLARIPLVRREQLRRDPERFLSDRADRGDLFALHSTGSTGEPVTVMTDSRGLFIHDLNRRRLSPLIASITGKRLRRRSAHLAVPRRPGASVNDAYAKRRLVSTGRVEHRTLSMLVPPAEMVRALDEFRPHLVSAYGSYLEELFAYMLTTGAGEHRPPLAIFTSDPASPDLRAEAARRLGIRSLGLYQAVEMLMLGFECEHARGFHINVDLCPIRVTDQEGRDVPAGEPGEVVISNLVNRATVLLNYALGDRGALELGPCECGRTLPRLRLLEGRTTEWLVAAGGERVHPQVIRLVVNRHPALWRYQIVQERPGAVKVLIVVDPAADGQALARDLRAGAAQAVGDRLEVSVECVDALERGRGGKTNLLVGREGGR